MFEDKRKIIIISGIIGLVIIIALIIWWLVSLRQKPIIDSSVPTAITATTTASYEPPIAAPPVPERLAEDESYPAGLKQLALSFAERYGSYSSDQPVKNLEELKPLMTEAFSRRVKGEEFPADFFVGFSTKALLAQLISLQANRAKINVKTQRVQTLGDSAQPRIFYVDLELIAVKVGVDWKIDEAVWK